MAPTCRTGASGNGRKEPERTRWPNRPAAPGICANETSAGASCGPIGPRAQVKRLEENAGGIPKKQLSFPHVTGEHGVRGVSGLLPDFEG